MCRSTSGPCCAISRLTPDLSGPCVAIVALAADKDAEGFVAELAGRASTIVFTDLPGSSRGRSPVELKALAESLGLVERGRAGRKTSAEARARTGSPSQRLAPRHRLALSRRGVAPGDRRGGPNAGKRRRAPASSAATAGPADGAQFPAHGEGAVGAVDRLRLLGLSSRTGGRPRRHARGRGRARGHADGQRQVASLPASCDRPRRPHLGGFAADRADARPGRPIARGRRRGGEPQFLLRSRRTPEGRARPRRAFAEASLYRARAAVARRHDRRLEEGSRSIFSPSTRRIASRNGATISAPNICACARSRKRLPGVQMIAVTATADEPTRAEIAEKLFVRPPTGFRALVRSPEPVSGHAAESGRHPPAPRPARGSPGRNGHRLLRVTAPDGGARGRIHARRPARAPLSRRARS